ncbi:DUF2971 domain-containing protein [Janthinobacterium sp. NKUCC08_JDC]|uniref:DUF2971 domain-containing protein n=1 Tax=Janthinobacterium sp. NKUCC08_JDC TaxID=2842122 RepID=UPI001C5B7FB5|nr:DUF2971 domain-containing protein [Janthinobacterium sp. NKUCC08_JDC]MBW3501344.1 DUF2971 domain-containing protein [Janthinobacterium sp. NKUCC08_JDC]
MLIYKYMPTVRFFTNFKIRFTPPGDLNDPLELVPKICLRDPDNYARAITARNLEPAIMRYQIEHPYVPQEKVRALLTSAAQQLEGSMDPQEKEREHFNSFMRVTNQNVGVLSLTTDPSSAPMWAHYADTYRGLAVGFDSDSNFFRPNKGEPENCGELVPVDYTNTPPVVFVDAGTLVPPKELFFTKAECWGYEKESRVIKFLPQAQEVIEVPNGLPIHLFEVPPDAIKEVIFGFRMSPEDRATVEAALANRAPHVALKKIEFVPNVGLQVMDC